MTFEECRLLIPQYLSGDLTPADYKSFEEALAVDAELRAEIDELRPVWDGMALLLQEQPSAALHAKFYQRLNAIERNRPLERVKLSNPWLRFWPQIAFGIVLFVSGLFVGRIRTDERAHVDELVKMSLQVQSLRELVALSLMDRQSAASRLEGVSWSNRIDRPNEEVVSALLRALNHDVNVNVRLSSVDALEKFTKNAAIGKALIDAIDRQDSPLVQIALIDSLVNIRNRAAAGEFKKLTAAADINPAVRQRAQWGLQKLNFE